MALDPILLRDIDLLHAEICAALADSKRIALLYALRDRPLTVTQLTLALDLPQARVSHHLKVLRERGMVRADRRGANVQYSIANPKTLQALDLLREVLSEQLRQRGALAGACAVGV